VDELLTRSGHRVTVPGRKGEFRFLRGDQPYKDNLPNENRPVTRVVLTGSLPGRLAVAARTARHRLRTARQRRPVAGASAPEPLPERSAEAA
jgi:hypothetical protein